jgi:hypothetical protein
MVGSPAGRGVSARRVSAWPPGSRVVEQALPRGGGVAGFHLLADGEGGGDRVFVEAGLEGGHVVGGLELGFAEGDAALGEQGAAFVAGLAAFAAGVEGDREVAGGLAGDEGQLGVAAVGLQPALLELLDGLGGGRSLYWVWPFRRPSGRCSGRGRGRRRGRAG